MIKKWKAIDWIAGLNSDRYEVSNYGEVRNTKTGHILKPYLNSTGYERIQIYINKKPVALFVHKLVAKAFLDTTDVDLSVCHLDSNRRNNRADNLRYNRFYSGGCQRNEACRKGVTIQYTDGIVKTYSHIRSFAEAIGVCVSTASKMVNGRADTSKRGFLVLQ